METYIVRYKETKNSTSTKSTMVEAKDPLEAKKIVESYGMHVISCLKDI
jgi:hypothetical protein